MVCFLASLVDYSPRGTAFEGGDLGWECRLVSAFALGIVTYIHEESSVSILASILGLKSGGALRLKEILQR